MIWHRKILKKVNQVFRLPRLLQASLPVLVRQALVVRRQMLEVD